MPRYIIATSIWHDGTGDYEHFEKIMKAVLTNPRFSDVEFIALVEFQDRREYDASPELNESIYLKIGERLRSLGITSFYGRHTDHKRYSSNLTVQHMLNEADQVIIISQGGVVYEYESYFKKGIPIKYIGEHEIRNNEIGRLTRSMGLSKGCYGIKIQDIPQMQPTQAWQVIQENDPEFLAQLLSKTNSENFDMFSVNNLLIPAYFNKPEDFATFLNVLSMSSSLIQGKTIVVYHSGYNFRRSARFGILDSIFKYDHIERIELFRPDVEPIINEINPRQPGTVNIKIFSEFHINNHSYNALYQLSKVAGVSGDNTFEYCISMTILPFYRSTNHRSSKYKTLLALKDITQSHWLSISSEARSSYNIFFDPDAFDEFQSNTSRERVNLSYAISKYQRMNFQAMIDAWPIVAEYLRRNNNFYHHLENIVLEGMLPTMRQKLTSFVSSWKGPFTLFKSPSVDTSQQVIAVDSSPVAAGASPRL